MSKIEKALNRARATGQLRVVTALDESQARHSMVPVTERERAADPEKRIAAVHAIARMRELSARSKNELADRRIIFHEMEQNETVKALRDIRTKIIQKTAGQNGVIMVSSVVGKGGGSFISFNLGAAFAFDAGRTALLVDCNLRNPSLKQLLGSDQQQGLTDFLENPELDISQIIHPIGIERLRGIPAGGQCEVPAEYFSSLKMRQLLDDVRQRYPERYIILDAPPLTDQADVQMLAELSDYVLIVVPYGKVTTSQLAASISHLSPEKLLGVVFNEVPTLPELPWRNMFFQSLVWLSNKITELMRKLSPSRFRQQSTESK
jgi:capsular exopolysaccharide synthesis family protein